MKEVKIEIADKEYKVLIAETEEERIQGLGNVESMDDDEGMLFIMPEDQGQVVFNTEEMEFDIDLVFIKLIVLNQLFLLLKMKKEELNMY